MKAKSKERKRQKVAEQAQQEEQVWLEAKRVEREQIEAERAERERVEAKRAERKAEEKRACKEEEISSEAAEVKKVVMDSGCTHCTWVKTICEFLVDGNKKQVTCIQCNQLKGKCWWPGDGKDTEASPKAKVDKGKKWKADDEMPEPRLSQKKQVKLKLTEVLEINRPEAGGSGARKAITGGLIANNLAGLFRLQEAVVKDSGWITDVLKAIINESYGFGVAVTPLDSGSSELDLDEPHEEAEWLQAEGEEEEAKGEDEPMAK
ncbi:hypothetical protein M404DRAFT_25285 [Pisolithus tinctorius Marx 270]|uniref:Uncharacterized protein n=1 Tax=Pisolithus tinctorius Marx 270 TaxID=870435 RepID=A0A0C3J940_PISTI|nr:hypothetical protein M404DRAFT_25285 [Pisolithus tinctorius Marx 270]